MKEIGLGKDTFIEGNDEFSKIINRSVYVPMIHIYNQNGINIGEAVIKNQNEKNTGKIIVEMSKELLNIVK